MFVLGLHGFSEVGKDAFADYLIAHHGWSGKLSFAKNLKQMCKTVFGFTDFQVETQEGKEQEFSEPLVFNQTHLNSVLIWMCRTHGSKVGFSSAEERQELNRYLLSLLGRRLCTSRQALQLVGTEVCRSVCPTYHIDVVIDNAPKEGNWVVTDVRFPNEADSLVGKFNAKIIKLSRPALNSKKLKYGHASESALSDWSGFFAAIENDKDLISLYRKIDAFLEENNLCRDAAL